jgi:hypothetical protein
MQPKGRECIPAPFLPPGRPKAKRAPLGGSKPKAQRGGFFLPPGRPKAKSAPLGDETIQCNMMMSAARGHGSQAPVDQDDGTME